MGIDVIIGVNGVIWIRKHTQDFTPEQLEADPDLLYSNDNEDIDDQTREAMARVRNCINALCERQQRIDVESLMQAYEHSLGYAAKDLLLPDLVSHITTKQ